MIYYTKSLKMLFNNHFISDNHKQNEYKNESNKINQFKQIKDKSNDYIYLMLV